jgi:hypothetical protein
VIVVHDKYELDSGASNEIEVTTEEEPEEGP